MTALHWHRPLMVLAVAMVVLVLVSLAGVIVDDRVLTGMPIWSKSAKFALSVLIYAVTWAWLIDRLTRWRRIAWWAGTVAAVGLGLELAVIVTQTVRGTTSHFNFATPLDSALWKTMGLTIIVVWVATLAVSLALFRAPTPDPAHHAAIRYGAALSLIGAALGILMVAPTRDQVASGSAIRGAHTVGLPDGGSGLPLLGWSTAGGDLRVPHFVGMHALQLLPLLLIAMEVAARWWPVLRSPARRAALTRVAAACYAASIAILTWQALRGRSVIHPDGPILAAFGLVVVGVIVATVVILRRRPAPVAPVRRAPVGAVR